MGITQVQADELALTRSQVTQLIYGKQFTNFTKEQRGQYDRLIVRESELLTLSHRNDE